MDTISRGFGNPALPSFDQPWRLPPAALAQRIACHDSVPENDCFEFQIISPNLHQTPFRKAIVLLHGLNERRWNRYLPWATALVNRLNRPVILFPIAFHMQRAPSPWSDPHAMHGVSSLRRQQRITATSFANAALSTRLHARPERFFWSGLQTVSDLVRLGNQVEASLEPLLLPNASLDLFAYSIGAFLSLILLSSSRSGPWSRARLFCFCGGCTLADCNPVSKEILDSAGANALRECFDHGLERTLATHPDLSRSFSYDDAGRCFHAMLHPARCVEQRRSLLAPLSDRLCALALAQDQVMPASAIQRTLAEARASFNLVQFPFACGHTLPFGSHLDSPDSSRAFESVFDRAALWLH